MEGWCYDQTPYQRINAVLYEYIELLSNMDSHFPHPYRCFRRGGGRVKTDEGEKLCNQNRKPIKLQFEDVLRTHVQASTTRPSCQTHEIQCANLSMSTSLPFAFKALSWLHFQKQIIGENYLWKSIN